PLESPVIDLSKDDQFNNIQSTIDRISAVTKRIIIEYPLPINKQKFYTPLIIKSIEEGRASSFDDLKIDYSFFWSEVQHVFKRLDSIKCSNSDRIYTYKLFCDHQVCRVFNPENLYSFLDIGTHYNYYAMKCIQQVYAEIVDDNYAKGYIS
uniref:SGNH domain-containing protein n=1 Tax=Parascaris univalens TaxID=6257 RepID=A0A915BUM1_PARUN